MLDQDPAFTATTEELPIPIQTKSGGLGLRQVVFLCCGGNPMSFSWIGVPAIERSVFDGAVEFRSRFLRQKNNTFF